VASRNVLQEALLGKYGFEAYRRIGVRTVAGWLESEVLEIISVLDAAQRSMNVSGAVAEIGVHHGRLFIGLNLLRSPAERAIAIDLFAQQERNVDSSGKGDLEVFLRNVCRWSSSDGLVVHEGDSTELAGEKLRELAGGPVRFFSVDGGHTKAIVLSDLKLAESAVAPAGVVIVDDVFNEQWPGVATGTLQYMGDGGQLVPFAIGLNKVFLCSCDYSQRYREALQRSFGTRYLLSVRRSEFAGHDVIVIARAPKSIRYLASRNPTAKALYRRFKGGSRADLA
jgi:hypothetical protein